MPGLTQRQVEDEEGKLFAYRERRFEMTARVDISRIKFDKTFKRQMDDRQNILRLERIMDTQGCQRLMKECHVPVLVLRADWEHRVRPRIIDGQLHQLDVDIDYRLRGQDHENLITAARNKLGPGNQWWMVDVYVTEQIPSEELLQKEFVRSLQERFPNDHRPPDGLIYQRIRYYEGYMDGPINRAAANHWWAILERAPRSKKGKYLRTFFKHPTLPEAFDELLPIAGIWEGMRIGLLHKLVAMRCDEPLLCYLNHIKKTFFTLMGDRDDLLAQLDGVTVKLLKSRVPKVSVRDLGFLQDQMSKGELFPDIEDPRDRFDIWERLQNIGYPIPTLETFFKDRLNLEVGRNVLQQLYIPDPQRKVTVDVGLGEQYRTSVPLLTSDRQHMIRGELYEFWRFSFQYGFEMVDHKRLVSRIKAGSQRASRPGLSDRSNMAERRNLWQHLFRLARDKNFNIPFTDELHAQPAELPLLTPCDYPESVEEDLPVDRRYGKPYTDTVEADQFALSQEALEQPWSSSQVTAVFVRRSVFLAFFRYLKPVPDSQFVAGNGPEANNISPTESSTSGNTNSDEMIPSSVIAPQENTVPLLPVFSAQDFDPTFASPVMNIQQPYCFEMKFIFPGEPEKLVQLPNDQSALSIFFEGFARHNFYVYSPDNPARGINERECYSIYFRNPFLRLHAEFLGVDYFETLLYPSTEPEETRLRKRRRTDGLNEIIDAKIWLNQRLNELVQDNGAYQLQIQIPEDEDIEY
ncbi:hypothetical protein N7455_006028 [Penicillium solitum]|uniref:uncharacterized protein n=1 Tax=Penicillium solitum TaxID=60172 RepID=UPI0032C3F05C|nr:hypothetical protein N7455_006028 [Penicillium solitum]